MNWTLCDGSGIRGYVHWKESWVRLYRGLDEKKILELNQSRERFLEELKPLIQGFRGAKKTVRERSEALYAFAVKNEVQKKLKIQERQFASRGQKAMEKEYAQIYGIVMELLNKMVEILGRRKGNRQGIPAAFRGRTYGSADRNHSAQHRSGAGGGYGADQAQ